MSGIVPANRKRPGYLRITGALFLSAVLILVAWSFSKENAEILSTKERAWLAAHPVIRFAPDPDFPPVEYFDLEGRYKGMTADYLELLEKKLGIRFKIVHLRDWSEIISKAKQRQIDMFAATSTPQRNGYLLFSSPYVELPAAIITREKVKKSLTMENLSGMKVSVVSGYATHDFLANNYPGLNLDVVPNVQTGLRKVSFGLSDVFVENLATASYYIEKEGIANLRFAGESGSLYRMSFASRKDWPELNHILEKGLSQINQDKRIEIWKKWIPLEPRTLFSNKKFQTAILAAFGGAVLFIAGIIAWNRALSRQVRRRTGQLEKELAERRQTENALRESEEKFRVLAETSPAGIFLYQGERIVYVNAAVSRFLGYTEQECLQMKFWDWVHDDFKLLVKERGLAKLRGENVPSRYECKHVSKRGEEKWIFISIGLVEYKGKSAGIVTGFDITDRKHMEEELKRARDNLEKRVRDRTAELEALNRTLEERVREEVAKNREKDIILIQQNRQAALGETLDHIAHQWKQPINAISLIVQDIGETCLQDELSKEYVYETVERILELIEHMAQTIEVFRDFYTAEKEKTVFRIKESIDKALIFIEPALRFDAIAVEIEAEPELSAVGYPKEFAQVLMNILANARDACRENGTKNPRVRINAFSEENAAVVTITDNAGGIPDDIVEKVFDLYFTTKRANGGTGIGLHMSKNIIEKNMGGILRAANVDGGAQFRIELNMPGC
jgi:PAS domain S-box-containing protein